MRCRELMWSMRSMATLLIYALASGCTGRQPLGVHDVGAEIPIPAASRQLVLVVSGGWPDTSGQLRRFERQPGGAWNGVGPVEPVNLGRSGLAWGRGLHAMMHGLQKKEGDGRAPAGVFRLSGIFGYAPLVTGLPYTQATGSVECIDDAGHPLYNRVIDTTGRARGWTSSERMRRDDDLYRIGVLVDHNVDPVAPGAGSCIFIHIWRGPGQPTSGCTSMAPETVEALTGWLQASASPVLVQLPAEEYQRLLAAWGLPPLGP